MTEMDKHAWVAKTKSQLAQHKAETLRVIATQHGLVLHGDRTALISRIAEYLHAVAFPPIPKKTLLQAASLDERRGFLRAMFWMAFRDDALDSEESERLDEIATRLGLSAGDRFAIAEEAARADCAGAVVGIEDSDARDELMNELVILNYVDGNDDARARKGLVQIARALNIDERQLDEVEREHAPVINIVRRRRYNTADAPTEAAQPPDGSPAAESDGEGWSAWQILAGSLVGGAVLAAGGWMFAPAIGAAVGGTMGLSGAAATSAGLASLGGGSLAAGGAGMAGGTALITSVAGGAGAVVGTVGSVGASLANAQRTTTPGIPRHNTVGSSIRCDLVHLRGGDDRVRIVIGVSGWKSADADLERKWKALGGFTKCHDLYTLRWESSDLFTWSVNIPEFKNAKRRADDTGRRLAEKLRENGLWGRRPVTLIGFSLGARVIVSAMNSLSKAEAHQSIEAVVLMGSALDKKSQAWQPLVERCDSIAHAYSRNDDTLKLAYRTSELAVAAGRGPLRRSGIIDVDVSDLVGGHNEYEHKMPAILERVEDEAQW